MNISHYHKTRAKILVVIRLPNRRFPPFLDWDLDNLLSHNTKTQINPYPQKGPYSKKARKMIRKGLLGPPIYPSLIDQEIKEPTKPRKAFI